ncbi:MAG: hypothetical protein KKD05_07215 [Candidatus Omnitrophica bacterium]|nr:hypothetical protein [Candidatus Omnitrophota bacterium]
MLKRLVKIIIGISLLPVCFGASKAFYELLQALGTMEQTMLYFLSGIGLYILLYFSGLKMSFLYVLGHESTHALLALLCGGKVKAFKVSAQGGSVAATKSNVLISLGPYCLPIYTILIIAGFFCATIFYPYINDYLQILILLIGCSIAFHFLMTVHSLRVEQPDITENGYLFSLTLIYLINLSIIALLLGGLFKQINILLFFRQTGIYTKSSAIFLWEKLQSFK